MYAKCDVERNEYLSLEEFVNRGKNGLALDQKKLVWTFVANERMAPHCGRSYPT